MAAEWGIDMQKRKISFGVLDLFLIVLVLVCIIGAVSRYLLTEENGILASKPEYTKAAISLLITDIEGVSSEYFVTGESFVLADIEAEGEVIADFTVTPAQYYTENENGELVISYHDEESGRIDCRGAVVVNGYYKDGMYLLSGEMPLTAGMYITLENGSISVTALVTDISSIS